MNIGLRSAAARRCPSARLDSQGKVLAAWAVFGLSSDRAAVGAEQEKH